MKHICRISIVSTVPRRATTQLDVKAAYVAFLSDSVALAGDVVDLVKSLQMEEE